MKGESVLKKNQPIKFARPMSTMRTVLLAVEHGYQYRADILAETRLRPGQVQAALYNLTYIGAVRRANDAQGLSVYLLPDRIGAVAPCLLGVRSIFDVR